MGFYIGNEDGDVFIFQAGKTLKLLNKTHVNSPVYSSIIAANEIIYIATQAHLIAVKKQ